MSKLAILRRSRSSNNQESNWDIRKRVIWLPTIMQNTKINITRKQEKSGLIILTIWKLPQQKITTQWTLLHKQFVWLRKLDSEQGIAQSLQTGKQSAVYRPLNDKKFLAEDLNMTVLHLVIASLLYNRAEITYRELEFSLYHSQTFRGIVLLSSDNKQRVNKISKRKGQT